MKTGWVTLILIIVLLLSACGGSKQTSAPEASSGSSQVGSDGHVTLEFWYALSGSSGKAVEELVKQFNGSQSTISVNATYQGNYGATIAKVWSAITAGGLPGVAQIGAAPLLGSTGAIVPISDFLEGPDGIDKTLIPAVFWDYNTAGGKLWSMPFNHSVPVLYYNRDLFSAAGLENPPETWDELIQTAQKLTLDTDQNGQTDQWGLNVADDTHWYLSTMFLENGAQIVNPAETEVLYNSPEAVQMLALWGDFVHTHHIMPANQHSEAKGDFLAGKLGMLLSSSSGIPSMEEDASFKVGVAMLPAVTGRDRALPVGGASLVIFKDSNPEIQKAAWAFVKFMTSKDSSLYLTTHTGYLPIYSAAADWPELVPYLQEHPNQVVPLESLKFATAIPEFSALGTSDSELRKAVETVELKAATPQEALDQAKKAVDKAITEQGDTP